MEIDRPEPIAADRLRAAFPLASGAHEIAARAHHGGGGGVDEVETRLRFETPPALPELVASDPRARKPRPFVRTGWIRLTLESPADAEALDSLELACEGRAHAFAVHAIPGNRIAVNPQGSLPAGAACELAWRAAQGRRALAFETAPAGPVAAILYDREDAHQIAPFPDDYWLAANPSDPTERGLRVSASGFGFPDQWLINSLARGMRDLDGFSPVGHLTIPLTDRPNPRSLPATEEDSVDPLASVMLFDLTPGADFATRVPFAAEVRTERTSGPVEHALLIFPSVSLQAGHVYGVVVSRRLWVSPGRPFEPSDFQRRALAPSGPGDGWSLLRARALLDDVLAVAGSLEPPVPPSDVAFAARFTVRSVDTIPDDLLSIRRQLDAAPPPVVEVLDVVAESADEKRRGSRVAAIVRGRFFAPDWRDRRRQLDRDPDTGMPRATRIRAVPFVLALPEPGGREPAPVVVFQHGNPGTAEDEVVDVARRSLARAGFAVAGFTDTLNREVSPPGPPASERAHAQMVDLLIRILATGAVPDYFNQTVAEQLSFLRALETLSQVERFEVRPAVGRARSTRAFAGIDASKLVYLGVSEGAHYGPMLAPFAPELRAAALVAPGRRFSEVLVHQPTEQILAPLAFLGFGKLSPTEVWVVLAWIQSIFDRQDPHLFAPHWFREPLDLGTERRASVLIAEGIGDRWVPNHTTRALARALGPVKHLLAPGRRVQEVFGLEVGFGSVVANVGPRTTAAYYQFVPQGLPGLEPTPGCASPPLSPSSASEGHYCAQSAAEALAQRVRFFETALSAAAPVAVDPLVGVIGD